MAEITPTQLADLLLYDPETGHLTWRPRDPLQFASFRAAGRWNSLFAGRRAFATEEAGGYFSGKLYRKRLKAHRVIWALVHGEWPEEVDHINGDKADNRLSNLRAVDHIENSRNRKLYSNNTNGAQGVHRRPSGRWGAYISIAGKRTVIGTFDTKASAIAARRSAERTHGYHPNHGRKLNYV